MAFCCFCFRFKNVVLLSEHQLCLPCSRPGVYDVFGVFTPANGVLLVLSEVEGSDPDLKWSGFSTGIQIIMENAIALGIESPPFSRVQL